MGTEREMGSEETVARGHEGRDVSVRIILLLGAGLATLAALVLALAGGASAGDGSPADERPLLLRDVGLAPHPGARLPLDAVFRDEAGEAAPLGRWLEGRPVVLSLVYFGCPMLCGEV